MRILVLGGDGYLGWPTALHLSALGHEVAVNDNFARRGYDVEMGVESLIPIATLDERLAAWGEVGGSQIKSYVGDLCDPAFVHQMVRDFHPETIVHFAEQRAAPYSMIDQAHAVYTQTNNVVGNLNVMYAIAEFDRDIHLVKLGTMGEYGQPNIDIEEGWLEVEHKGRKDRMIYPKKPGSFYHCSKVHDSHNLEFGCRIWGLRATDLNQGVVYGADTEQTKLDPRLATRFDYDGVFGTVLNRMVIQAVLGHPLTVYGNGSQTRGLINIVDTVECIRLASENPAASRRVPRLQPDDRDHVDPRDRRDDRQGVPGHGDDRARRQSRAWRSTTTTTRSCIPRSRNSGSSPRCSPRRSSITSSTSSSAIAPGSTWQRSCRRCAGRTPRAPCPRPAARSPQPADLTGPAGDLSSRARRHGGPCALLSSAPARGVQGPRQA